MTKNVGKIPVLPIPAEQWTTTGGPREWPAQVSPRLDVNLSWELRTNWRNPNIPVAHSGTP